MAALKLDRSHTNLAFGSWKYCKDLIMSSERIPLPERVYKPEAGGHGFLATRAHVMHNHLHQQGEGNDKVAEETAIKILAAKQPITDPNLCSYLLKRKIEKNIADKYCHEINFTIADKEYKAIGFKNNAGGYELRKEFFKGSNSPKYISYLDNNANNITVFEGFFDFLSYQSINQNQQHDLTNFLVLNSLSFFERSLLLMEKHESIHLYLDNDEAGRKCTSLAQKRSLKFKDESKLYESCKDLNEWNVKIKEHNINQKIKEVRHRMMRHL